MYLILVNGGGSSPFDKIALKHGWKLGINSLKKTSGKDLFMIDNPFQNYNHQRHLKAVKKYHPHLATIPDILEDSDQHLIYSQAIELQNYCNRLIIIPKTKIECKYLQLTNLIIGLPCGRFKNKWSRYYCDNTNLPIHLLGGSPKQWRFEINNYASRIYSMDGNYLSKIASFGKIYLDFTSRSRSGAVRSPLPYEVESGKDFIYRCYDFSLANFHIQDLFSHQLNLVFS